MVGTKTKNRISSPPADARGPIAAVRYYVYSYCCYCYVYHKNSHNVPVRLIVFTRFDSPSHTDISINIDVGKNFDAERLKKILLLKQTQIM